MQPMVHQYAMPTQLGHPGMLQQQQVRPLGYGQPSRSQAHATMQPVTALAQQLNPRQFQHEALGLSLSQRGMAPASALQPRGRTKGDSKLAAGEVAKTLLPNRSDPQMYAQQSYLTGTPTQTPKSNFFNVDYSRPQTSTKGGTESTSSKRTAASQMEQTTTKAARHTKSKRVEDPSAPDIGDMDVVAEAAIHLGEEQAALLTDFPSQGVTDPDAQEIESDILDVDAVKTRLQQVLADQGMQLAGQDVVDVVVQGMEEKFEAFLTKVLKHAIHRTDTAYVKADTDSKAVTSDVRTKLREIKKKQEQHKAAKLREEREKLEQLAETASKKELANNKELAAKVEKVKREKQFNAEAEAANRALSNALGGFGFEKYRKKKKDREAREAARAAASVSQPPTTQAAIPPTSQPVTFPKPAPLPKPPVVEEKRPVVLNLKDIISVMSGDNNYSFSPILYRLLL